MLISDPLYGEFEIDGLLEELIVSKPVQRLKEIHQAGAGFLVNSRWTISRFEHSVGVMLLIRQLGGSLQEQVAGLLHDVSHTAFSHVVDVVLENEAEDYHEAIFMDVIKQSSIPAILEKYGYEVENILDTSRWSLLEQPAPALCADRIDYTLRDMYFYGNLALEDIQKFLQDLFVFQGKLCVKTIERAEWFVKIYYQEVLDFFLHPLNIYATSSLANVLKLSLAKQILTLEDFLKTDHEVLQQMKASHDRDVQALVQQLHENVEVREEQENYDIHFRNKVRLIDPAIYHQQRLWKASEVSNYVKAMNISALERFEQGVYVKIINEELS
ncbi:HD domain-containing protein [Lysinibacillus boronitolerans]|uniref:HD domain-containing protein n=1 Tax=Lysinibacillus boronitolerans TaxID=309788 RepID=UPI000306E738|nr:HD domain-containing protein [Lysinibacillus boronitolerans]